MGKPYEFGCHRFRHYRRWLVVNPILIYYKRKYGHKLDSPALLADAKDTFICLYQTVVVLIGLFLVKWLGWWWADPVAALLIVPYAAKEGLEAYSKAQKIKNNIDKK